MRSIFTIAVVRPELAERSEAAGPQAAERLVLDAAAGDEVAFLRVMLNGWDESERLLVQWLQERRSPAAEPLTPLLSRGLLCLRTPADFGSRPSPAEISKWYRDRSLAERDVQLAVASFYDASEMQQSTRLVLLLATRRLGPALGDESFRG